MENPRQRPPLEQRRFCGSSAFPTSSSTLSPSVSEPATPPARLHQLRLLLSIPHLTSPPLQLDTKHKVTSAESAGSAFLVQFLGRLFSSDLHEEAPSDTPIAFGFGQSCGPPFLPFELDDAEVHLYTLQKSLGCNIASPDAYHAPSYPG